MEIDKYNKLLNTGYYCREYNFLKITIYFGWYLCKTPLGEFGCNIDPTEKQPSNTLSNCAIVLLP